MTAKKNTETFGIDPFTGEEKEVGSPGPTMVPQSRGTVADVTFPSHMQAPPQPED